MRPRAQGRDEVRQIAIDDELLAATAQDLCDDGIGDDLGRDDVGRGFLEGRSEFAHHGRIGERGVHNGALDLRRVVEDAEF